MADVQLSKGYHLRLEGSASPVIEDAQFPDRIAVKPGDFTGLKIKMLVEPGDVVKVGSPLFSKKENASILFTSPVSGKVIEVTRGDRRVIREVVIETDGKQKKISVKIPDSKISSLKREEIIPLLLKTGLFSYLIQRPFGKIADPEIIPRDIFISAMNTAPLSADCNIITAGKEKEIKAGIEVLKKLTGGKVHISLDSSKEHPLKAVESLKDIEKHYFRGPHPAGNTGVQIHHISPIKGKDDIVWTISTQGVLDIGHLFLQKEIPTERIVAVAGSAAINRKYYRTIRGAQIFSFIPEHYEENIRFISGNVLTGEQVSQEGFLSFYDNVVSIIHEPEKYEFLGWTTFGSKKLSLSRTFLSYYLSLMKPDMHFEQKASVNGGKRAFIVSGVYEKVLPMDILPVFLLKAILAEDIEEMEGLGIYEVIEEDLALCEYVDPSKNDIQKILRQGLDLIEREA